MKIGIVTHFYNTNNYGGILQAFAMCRILEKCGYTSEQLRFIWQVELLDSENRNISLSSKVLFRLKNEMKNIFKGKSAEENRIISQKRRELFFDWAKTNIPQSSKIYDLNTIDEASKEYDAFVAGSDQVWNPNWYSPIFFLEFVKNKPKISYAASIGTSSLTEKQKKTFQEHLSDFSFISVREEDSVKLLEEVSSLPIKVVLDPVLLLQKDEWEQISTPAIVFEKYIFCYFLISDKDKYQLVKKYAERKGLKIVYINGVGNNKYNSKYFDIAIDSALPTDFISLIKNAEVVFTDSFHATVFSGIFEKQFFVFNRKEQSEMKCRIYDITKLFSAQENFCDTVEKLSVEYIESLDIPKYDLQKIQEKRKNAIEYLNNALSDVIL